MHTFGHALSRNTATSGANPMIGSVVGVVNFVRRVVDSCSATTRVECSHLQRSLRAPSPPAICRRSRCDLRGPNPSFDRDPRCAAARIRAGCAARDSVDLPRIKPTPRRRQHLRTPFSQHALWYLPRLPYHPWPSPATARTGHISACQGSSMFFLPH